MSDAEFLEWYSGTFVSTAGMNVLASAWDSGTPLRARAAALPERGWKSRVVTSHPELSLQFGFAARRVLDSLMSKDPRIIGVARRPDHRAGVEAVFTKFGSVPMMGDCQFLSEDLTSASDSIHMDAF